MFSHAFDLQQAARCGVCKTHTQAATLTSRLRGMQDTRRLRGMQDTQAGCVASKAHKQVAARGVGGLYTYEGKVPVNGGTQTGWPFPPHTASAATPDRVKAATAATGTKITILETLRGLSACRQLMSEKNNGICCFGFVLQS